MVQMCERTFLNEVGQTTPSLVPIYTAFFTQKADFLIDLMQRKISWGDYVRGVSGMVLEFQAELTSENQRIQAGLYQENQAELVQRRAAATALARWAQKQEMIARLVGR